MHREPLQENLLDELTRLVGRPRPLIQDVLAHLLESVSNGFDRDLLSALAPFPMTSWPSIAGACRAIQDLWAKSVSAGLTAEEVFTALAVLDDHVRRVFGADAWSRAPEWAPRLACRYDLATDPARVAPPKSAFPSPS